MASDSQRLAQASMLQSRRLFVFLLREWVMFKREDRMSQERRQFIKGSAALAAGPALSTGACT